MEDKYFNKYLKYKYKYYNLKNKQLGGGNPKKEVYLFKAEWCPHCVNFLPDWKKLEENHSNEFNFIKYDSDENPEKVSEWQVKGFPSIFIKSGDSAYEYMGMNNYKDVLAFIKNI